MTRTLTDLLTGVERGDDEAASRVFGLLYDELRRAAHGQRDRWLGDAPLTTTALVHESYLKLVGAGDGAAPVDRGHFLRIAARAMRYLLCNEARDRRRLKRGGHLRRTDAEPDELPGAADLGDIDQIVALDEALERLVQIDERAARVVECRFFAGLSIAETAEAVGASAATVKRDWKRAREWLYAEVASEEPGR